MGGEFPVPYRGRTPPGLQRAAPASSPGQPRESPSGAGFLDPVAAKTEASVDRSGAIPLPTQTSPGLPTSGVQQG